MSRLLLPLLLALPLGASAGELNFSPDRPGVGESTAAVGAGHVMIEGGLAGAIVGGNSAFGTASVIGRIGVADPVEVRVRIPDFGFTGGGIGGAVGVGAKIAAPLADGIGFSVVPELTLATPGADPGANVGANLTFGGAVGGWVHGNVGYQGALSALIGGGVSAGIGSGGIYANAAVLPGAATGVLVGGGGWFGFTPAFQMDAGLDVMIFSGVTALVPMIGASGGF